MDKRLSLLFASLLASQAALLPTTQAAWPPDVDGQPLPSLAPMLKKATPAVVNISTKTKIEMAEHPLMSDPFFRRFFEVPNMPRQKETSSLGSGVIVDANNGYIITNNHVIDKADQIQVTLNDSRQLSAKLVGSDSESDIAVIKVEPNNLTELPVADSSSVQVGDFVVAIGNPFGLGQSVTSGIVSALGRSGLGIEGYEDFIQTDASINPGNSGGALVNLRGELVGINTAILAPNGGNVGIGFAIPSNMADKVKKILLEHGAVKRGQLGVAIQDLTPDLAQAFGLKQTQGAAITSVQPNSPAAKAGLEPGDIVLSVNDKPVKHGQDVRNAIGLLPLGEEVKLEIMRGGSSQTVKAEIAAPKLSHEDGQKLHPKLAGLVLENTGPHDPVEGVKIAKIHTGSRAFRAGLRPGDIITMVNRQAVASLDGLTSAAPMDRHELLLNVQRGEQVFFILLR